MRTRTLLLSLIWLLSAASAAAIADGYDSFAGILTPTSPFNPTSQAQCSQLAETWTSLIARTEAAHDGCLAAAENKGGLQATSAGPRQSGTCSNKYCQAIHTRLFGGPMNIQGPLQKQKDSAVEACRNSVRIYLAAKGRSGDACVSMKAQYKAVCVGNHESASDAATCARSLASIRQQCAPGWD